MADDRPTHDRVLADVKATVHDAIAGPWLKRWLDIRTFLAQRRALLLDSTLALDDEIRSVLPGWKTPVQFAIQGLILPSVVIQIIGVLLSVLLVRPTPYLQRVRVDIESAAALIQRNIEIVAAAPASTVFVWRRDLRLLPSPFHPTTVGTPARMQPHYLKRLQAAKHGLTRTLKLLKTVENVDAASRLVLPLVPSIVFVVAAFVFRMFARATLGQFSRDGGRRAHEVFFVHAYGGSILG